MSSKGKSAILRSSPWVLAGLAALFAGGFLPESSSLVPCCGASIPYRFLVGGVGILLMVPALREGVLFAVRIKSESLKDREPPK